MAATTNVEGFFIFLCTEADPHHHPWISVTLWTTTVVSNKVALRGVNNDIFFKLSPLVHHWNDGRKIIVWDFVSIPSHLLLTKTTISFSERRRRPPGRGNMTMKFAISRGFCPRRQPLFTSLKTTYRKISIWLTFPCMSRRLTHNGGSGWKFVIKGDWIIS